MAKQPEQDEIMTLAEIAGYLKVSEKTMLRLVQSGQFPGVKVSNQWRFMRTIVDDWLSSRMYTAPTQSLRDVVSTETHVIPLTRLVSNRRIVLGIDPGGKADVLKQLVSPLKADGLIEDPDRYTERLLAREELVSTGIGHGLAIPHVREPQETAITQPCIVLGMCREGTDFGALDGEPTYVFAMPCSSSEAVHLRLLARISLVFRSPGVLRKMTLARTKKDVLEILAKTDSELAGIKKREP